MPYTAFYGGLLALLFIVLSFRCVLLRRSQKIALGDGDNKLLRRRMRVQANFAEYVPIALILIALLESVGTVEFILHALGGSLLFARILHAVGMSREPDIMFLRVAGTVITYTVIGFAAVWSLGAPFGR